MKKIIPNALTIAGSDSGGGAGVQADLKSFSANKVFGASVLTALTAQNTIGVTAIHDVPAGFVQAQLDAVYCDIEIDAVKIGMMSQVPIIDTVATALEKYSSKNVVFDPVMVATSGDLLLAPDAIDAVIEKLVPAVDVITPNLFEAAALSGQPLAEDDSAMLKQAEILSQKGAKAVLIKGGHGKTDNCADLLFKDGQPQWFNAQRVNTSNTHGTGCSLSSAIASQLAHGESLSNAVQIAKNWITGAIAKSDDLSVGQGNGPVHHFHELWS